MGCPLDFKAVIFDLDGVITKTARVHSAAWKAMFDEYLKLRETRDGEPFKEFMIQEDYKTYVDGKPRYQGVQSFLESRDIHIPFGDPSDDPQQETVCGLGNRKNIKFREVLKTNGVEQYPATVEMIRALKDNGVHIGVASSSKNCQFVLQAAGLEELFETRVDGVVSAELGLKGKPDGDIFTTACKNVGCQPLDSVVVEDAVSGVQAGKNGGFGFVLGIARKDNQDELKENGADAAIADFEGVTLEQMNQWFLESRKDKS